MKHKTLSFKKGFRVHFNTKKAQAVEMVLAAGGKEGDAENMHKGADQWLFVFAGTGVAIINGRYIKLKSGTLILIEKGDKHEIRNNGRRLLRTLNFYIPPAYKKNGKPLPRGKKVKPLR